MDADTEKGNKENICKVYGHPAGTVTTGNARFRGCQCGSPF